MIFSRTELLLGTAVMEKLVTKRVIVFGVGGVGSWCAEVLGRSGIHHLTIVDCDIVAASNINRQLMATTETIGRAKVEVLRERLLTINPNADITALQRFFSKETAEEFHLQDYDYIIDAIDSLKDKALLILLATSSPHTGGGEGGPKFFSSMGAALKIDPTRIRVAEFWKVHGDPLARAIRKKFKHQGLSPEKKFLCVYSDEVMNMVESRESRVESPPLTINTQHSTPNTQSIVKAQINGSLAHITAIFGCTIAGLVLQDVVKSYNQ